MTFHAPGAIGILGRRFGQVDLDALAAQEQLPQADAVHRVAPAGFADHEAEELEAWDAFSGGFGQSQAKRVGRISWLFGRGVW